MFLLKFKLIVYLQYLHIVNIISKLDSYNKNKYKENLKQEGEITH